MKPSVVRWQIVTPFAQQAADFYAGLFDWKVERANALAYREVRSEGMEGGIWPAPPEAPSFVQLFVEVDDPGAYAARAVELGATIVVPVSTLPDGDVMAVVRDPAGVTFGICSLSRR